MEPMRSQPTRAWRGMSAEARRSARRARLVAAGLELIGTIGWRATTVRGLCAEAGLTERYFYESFGDREELLLAVFEQVLEEGVRVVLDAFAAAPDGDARVKTRSAIAAAVDLFADDPRKGRVLLLEAMGEEALQRRRQETMIANAALLSELAQGFLGPAAVDPSDAGLTALALVGAVAELLTAYLSGRVDVTRERLVDHLTELFLAAAGISSLPRSA